MRFAVIADTHIGRSIPLAIGEHRRKAFSEAFAKIVDHCVARGVDYVFIGGDLFERRTLRPHLVQFIHDELHRLVSMNKEKHGLDAKILVIRGNHDGRPTSDTLDYIKHPLADYLHVFGDDPSELVYKDENLYVVGLNYYDQIDKAFEILAEPAFKAAEGIKIFMVHGFIQAYNSVPPYSRYLTLDQLASLDPDFVFTGHYHRRCQPKKLSNGGWLISPGSPEMYDFAENPEKGFYFIETGDEPKFEWVPIEPAHIMKQVRVQSDRRRSPDWYMGEIMKEVNGFIEELNSKAKDGYIRITVQGKLSKGFPSDISNTEIQVLVKKEPRLLWVDLVTLNLDLPSMMARPEKNSRDVAEYFSDFGEFKEDIRDMHSHVKDVLDNKASEQTGLLKKSDRASLIMDWVERFEARTFMEDSE